MRIISKISSTSAHASNVPHLKPFNFPLQNLNYYYLLSRSLAQFTRNNLYVSQFNGATNNQNYGAKLFIPSTPDFTAIFLLSMRTLFLAKRIQSRLDRVIFKQDTKRFEHKTSISSFWTYNKIAIMKLFKDRILLIWILWNVNNLFSLKLIYFYFLNWIMNY